MVSISSGEFLAYSMPGAKVVYWPLRPLSNFTFINKYAEGFVASGLSTFFHISTIAVNNPSTGCGCLTLCSTAGHDRSRQINAATTAAALEAYFSTLFVLSGGQDGPPFHRYYRRLRRRRYCYCS